LKIAYLSRSCFPSTAANSVNVMKMCEAFTALGHDVLLIGKFAGNNSSDVFDFYRVKKRFRLKAIPSLDGSATDVLYVVYSIWEASKFKPDLAYGRSLESCFGTAILGIPTAYEIHAKPRTLLKRVLLKRLVAMSSFKSLVAITQGLASYLNREGFVAGEKLFVAHDGADPEDFNASVPPAFLSPRAIARGLLKGCLADARHDKEKTVGFEDKARYFQVRFSELPPNRLQVGYVGSLYYGKGMEIISRIVHLCPWANFHIVGGSEKEIAFWKERCAENSIPPNLVFYGFMPHALISYICSFLDVALLPAQPFIANVSGNIDEIWYVSPLKLFEYMAAGLPIVASDLESLNEVIEPGVTGLLVPHDDPLAWRDALSFLRDHPEWRAKLGHNAREALVNRFSWKRRAEKILSGLKW